MKKGKPKFERQTEYYYKWQRMTPDEKYQELATYFGVDEYPLYEHHKLCPSARYVAGVSRYLCECPKPLECKGVQKVREEESNEKPTSENRQAH